MSQRIHRTLVVCVALAGCDTPEARPEPSPAPAPAATRPEPAPAEKQADPPAPAPAPQIEPPPLPSSRIGAELKQAVVRSINRLTIDLQRKLAREPGNLVVSGVSVSVALAMLHAGSGGATARELAGVLRLDDPPDDIHAGFAGLAARWTHTGEHMTFIPASRLFGAESFAFKPEYIDLTRTVFGAPLEPLDFAADPAAARDKINSWVRERTGETIDEVVPEGSIDAAARLVLTGAAYFKADWLEPFDPAATAPLMFHGVEHRRPVPMMHGVQRLRVAFGLSGKIRVLDLPYKGGDYSLVIVLPTKRDGLKAVEKLFDADKLQGWLDAAKVIPTELKLPRFSLDSDIDLAPALAKLGATRVFEAKRADFGAMAGEKKLALTDARHRARFVVEERGSGASAPAIEISVGNAPTNTIPFIVDRPFLFYVRDNRSGALLLHGRVTEPPA